MSHLVRARAEFHRCVGTGVWRFPLLAADSRRVGDANRQNGSGASSVRARDSAPARREERVIDRACNHPACARGSVAQSRVCGRVVVVPLAPDSATGAPARDRIRRCDVEDR